ncbi:hydroxypyruvate isomerase family protein [Aeromonas cavernicola]|uniref:Hydroxypyruvate isomerase n=1 Tax=Aeromonas cavernicola TaxID=1006623 RepID=A0A2H9U552_9GAMM|nr:TIM barrel protein [Aeromonas cavernicola]PJG59172.1 hydroxypyruvate isomerase [Aeromonas cavernicola]
MAYTVNCSILLTDLPLLARPAAAKAAGFSAVEFWWPFDSSVPSAQEVEGFISAIESAGVALTGLNFNAGNMPGGDRGLLSSPTRSAEFKDNIDVVVEIGRRLGCKAFNALYGLRESGYSAAQQDDIATENLAMACRAVATIGGIVLLEPLSGAEHYPLKTAEQAMAIITRVEQQSGVTNLRLLADFYHLASNGDNVAAVIEQYAHQFGHIQIADVPGRGEPGTGELPLDTWIKRSQALGYQGHIGLEYKATQADPFAWLAPAQRA